MTATRARKPRRVLTSVEITKRFPAFRSGRPEAWEAVSRDGVWRYERIEVSGTPWITVYVPAGIEGNWYGTLAAARAATADGTALEYINRLMAHYRGEHEAERDVRCGRC